MTETVHPHRPSVAYPILATLIVGLLAAMIVARLQHEPGRALPREFRLSAPRLSGLPVRIDRVQSCSCWHGPRNQAQRKFKLRVANDWDRVLNISGGSRSALRLIVAYPGTKKPSLTFPQSADDDELANLDTPDDFPVPIAKRVRRVNASRIDASHNELFGVPTDYTLWALPPTPNKLAEPVETYAKGTLINGSFPTVVDKTVLLPGEQYHSMQLGHGVWTFYIPIEPSFARIFKGEFQVLPSREEYEKEVIFVGIGAFHVVKSELVELLGFAPAPADDELLDPVYL